MSANLKDKKLVVIAIAAAVVVIVGILIFLPGKKADEDSEVISKRVKLDIHAPVDATADLATTQAPMAEAPAAPAPPLKAETAAPVAPEAGEAMPAKAEPAVEKPAAPKKEAVARKAAAKPARKVSAKAALSKPWAINVASFSNLPEAQSLAGALKKAGYNAYITPFTKDGVLWQRVRVGFFATKDDALKAGNRIKARFNVQSPWIVKPGSTEAGAHR